MSYSSEKLPLSESLEDYLEVMLRYSETGAGIRLTDIASHMNVSKPSAHQAVQRLKDMGFVSASKYDAIHLTQEGRDAAARISRRHNLLVSFLSDVLGVSKEAAEKDACRIEHVICRETMDRITAYVEKSGQIDQSSD